MTRAAAKTCATARITQGHGTDVCRRGGVTPVLCRWRKKSGSFPTQDNARLSAETCTIASFVHLYRIIRSRPPVEALLENFSLAGIMSRSERRQALWEARIL